MRGKSQMTQAKLARERRLQERRELKREKKQAAAAARREGEAAPDAPTVDVEAEWSPRDAESVERSPE